MAEIYLHTSCAALFCLVFLFLWKQSGIRAFAWWSAAFACAALPPLWPAAAPLLNGAFALLLVLAAGAPPAFLLLPALVVLAQTLVPGPYAVPLNALAFAAIYVLNFRNTALGPRRLFHFTLLALALTSLLRAFRPVPNLDLALDAVLAFSAMALWIDNQKHRITELVHDLDRLRRDTAQDGSLDALTGLLNQDSFRKRLDAAEPWTGVVAVCDLDNFKSINDRFGHVVGDEVLRNVGHLLHSSIRAEDFAYRWGGDEFAILFSDQESEHARTRMEAIEARLQHFRVRGYTSLEISFCWGVSQGHEVALRQVLEQADRNMYAKKRTRPQSRPATT